MKLLSNPGICAGGDSEDPWEHLYAYLEWFARWTQRVMPNAVWKEAMQQSKKTLLPCS